MGCGMSRYGLAGPADHEEGPPRSSNPIRRKFEELRRNDRDTNPSTKLLLKKGGGSGGDDDDAVDSNSSRKSIDTVNDLALEQKKNTKTVDDGLEEKGRKEVESKNEEVKAMERGNNKDNEESEEDDQGRFSDYDGSLWIGSPSFRDYCIDCDSEDNFENDGNASAGKKKETNTRGDKCNESPKSNKGLETKSMIKERFGRRFSKKVFPKSRPSGMKSFLHVTSCYNPNVSASRDKIGKPIEKTI